jgi:hypothetical protein
MGLNIVRGKKSGAVRAVIYGTEGIGKSTLAAQIPDALIIDTEDGTGQIDAARVIALDWRAIEHAVKELIADQQGFRAVVIDTADWLEKALVDWMLRQSGKKSIEDYGFGKGYTILAEHVTRFLGLLDQLVAKGVHVVFVAHAKVVRTSPPDQTDGFDRYELKLTKQVAPLVKEWADLVLFCNYRIQVVEGSDGRLKAQGGKERIMHAVHSAAWDAKNRFGLPEEMPMEFARLAHLFGAAAPRHTPEPPKVAAVEAAVVADPTPVDRATAKQVERIAWLRGQEGATGLIDEALAYCEAIDLDELHADIAANLILKLEGLAASKRTPKPVTKLPVLPPNVAAWLEANEDAANAYLVNVQWLKAGETWRDLSADRADAVVDKFDKFKGAALAHAKSTGRKAA